MQSRIEANLFPPKLHNRLAVGPMTHVSQDSNWQLATATHRTFDIQLHQRHCTFALESSSTLNILLL